MAVQPPNFSCSGQNAADRGNLLCLVQKRLNDDPQTFIDHFNANYDDWINNFFPVLLNPANEKKTLEFLLNLSQQPGGLKLAGAIIRSMYQSGPTGQIRVTQLMIRLNNPAQLLKLIHYAGIDLNRLKFNISLAARKEEEIASSQKMLDKLDKLSIFLNNIVYVNMSQAEITKTYLSILDILAQYYTKEISLNEAYNKIQKLPSARGGIRSDGILNYNYLVFNGLKADEQSAPESAEVEPNSSHQIDWINNYSIKIINDFVSSESDIELADFEIAGIELGSEINNEIEKGNYTRAASIIYALMGEQ